MRALATIVLTSVVLTAPAHACPRDVSCIIAVQERGLPEVARPPVTRPPARAVHLAVPVAAVAPTPLHAALLTPARPPSDEPSMPWIWQVIRAQAHQRLPRYEGEDAFSLTVAPVVVAGTFDTIPGVGVSGDF